MLRWAGRPGSIGAGEGGCAECAVPIKEAAGGLLDLCRLLSLPVRRKGEVGASKALDIPGEPCINLHSCVETQHHASTQVADSKWACSVACLSVA